MGVAAAALPAVAQLPKQPPPPARPPLVSPPADGAISAEGRAALLAGGDAPTMREALLERGFALKHYSAGEQRILCPRCGGGSDREQSLSLRIEPDGQGAVWHCFRGTCGWSGGVALNDYKIRHAALGPSALKVKGKCWWRERERRECGEGGRAGGGLCVCCCVGQLQQLRPNTPLTPKTPHFSTHARRHPDLPQERVVPHQAVPQV